MKNKLHSELEISGEKVQLLLKKKKSISIRVTSEGKVLVSAPYRTNFELIKALICKKQAWINKRKNFYKSCVNLINNKSYEDGTAVLLFGQNHYIKYNQGPDDIRADKQNVIVFSKRPLTRGLRVKRINSWYEKISLEVFHERMNLLSESIKGLHQKKPTLSIRRMRRLWGSCSSSGKINLNIHLIKVPMICIDYVIMHELCHLVYMNHGKKFYNLLTDCMPDWKERLLLLKKYIISG